MDNRTGSLQVGCLRVHPPAVLAVGTGGELLELGKALLSLDTGLCPLITRTPAFFLPQVHLGLVAQHRHLLPYSEEVDCSGLEREI